MQSLPGPLPCSEQQRQAPAYCCRWTLLCTAAGHTLPCLEFQNVRVGRPSCEFFLTPPCWRAIYTREKARGNAPLSITLRLHECHETAKVKVSWA